MPKGPDEISHNPGPETWEEYYCAMYVFTMMPEDATKGEIREAITKMLMAKRKAEEARAVGGDK